MANVYRARQPQMDRAVAIKVIHAQQLDQVGRERFQREARLIARLENPHILPVYDFDGSHNPPYIVMRYIPGGTLKDLLGQGPLPLSDCFHILNQVAVALDYAHRQGIIHRDLKPSNILIDREGNAFLADFGIARFTKEATLTGSGMLMGTPAYIAPEQVTGGDLSGAADLYSLAVLSFEALTGQLPFEAETQMAMLMKHVSEAPRLASACSARLNPALDGVLLQAMAKNPAERQSSAVELIRALSAAAGLAAESGGEFHTVVGKKAGSPLPRTRDTRDTRSQDTPARQNKIISLLAADAGEYAQLLSEARGAETASKQLRLFWERAVGAIQERGGQVSSQEGASLLAVWGAMMTREDDAAQTVRAALDVQAILRELAKEFLTDNEALPLRVAIHTGHTLVDRTADGGYSPGGASVTIVQRFCEQADGLILISQDTYRLARGLFDVQPGPALKLRGQAPLDSYQVSAAKKQTFIQQVRAPRLDGSETRLVGREAELVGLQKACLFALEEGETQWVSVLGEAGLGKSRLLDEFTQWAELRPETFRLFQSRATTETSRQPYALWRGLFGLRFAIADADPVEVVMGKMETGVEELSGQADREMAHLIGQLCGFDFSVSPFVEGMLGDGAQLAQRGRLLTRRFFERVLKLNPILMVFEDIHQADEASLDFLLELGRELAAQPLLIICTARPSLLQLRPGWNQSRENHQTFHLQPLNKIDSRSLAAELTRRIAEAPKPLRDLLVERSAGNPLFMEELFSMLVEERIVIPGAEPQAPWRVEVGRLERLRVPPSLAGILQSRFDNLLYPEKLTLQRAAAVGQVFSAAMLEALDAADETHVDDVPAILAHLAERGLILSRPVNREYAFVQSLLRDQIYSSLVNQQVQTYHRAAAEFLQNSERASELQLTIGEQYEKAGLREQAAEAFLLAAEQANDGGFYRDATRILQHAHELSPDNVSILWKLGDSLSRMGQVDIAIELTQEALSKCTNPGDKINITVSLAYTYLRNSDLPKLDALIEQLLPMVWEGDTHSWTRFLSLYAGSLADQGDLQKAVSIYSDALEVSKRENDVRQIVNNNLGLSFMQLCLGNLSEAEAYGNEALKMSETNIAYKLLALNQLGIIADKKKDYPAALNFFEQALTMAHETENAVFIMNEIGNLLWLHTHLGNMQEAHRCQKEIKTILLQSGESMIRVRGKGIVYDGIAIAFGEGQVDRGLALYGLIRSKSFWDSMTQFSFDTDLDIWQISPEAAEAGMKAGEALDWDATVRELLEQMGGR
jgi:class 3 adenylate cyclase/tetratricopeptide (TPR) repeat protein